MNAGPSLSEGAVAAPSADVSVHAAPNPEQAPGRRVAKPSEHGLEFRRTLLGLTPATVDVAARTVDLTVSTGSAVRRYDWQKDREFDEVLAIGPTSIRLDRLNRGAPLLDSHRYWGGLDAQIGAIVPGTARIEQGQLRATAKFSRNPAGEAVFTDVRDGVVRNCSVGYVTHAQEIDETRSPAVYRATDWEPFEVSMVPMPADPGAGVRSITRSVPQPEETPAMTEAASAVRTPEPAPLPPPTSDAQIAAAASAAVTAERARIAGIEDIGRRLNLAAEFVGEHRNGGTSLEEFRVKALDKVAELGGARVIDPANPEASGVRAPAIAGRHKTVEMKKGQMASRLVRLLAAAKGDPDRAIRIARMPAWDDGHRDLTIRALTAGVGAGGGFLIPEEYSEEVIELLRPRTVVRALGARQIPMPGGNLNMPRLQGGATASYVGEAVPTNASQESFGNVKLSEKKLMALVPVSNDLIKFASPQADQVVLEDMVAQIAVAEDQAFIRGSGTQFSPKGMRNWAPTATNLPVSSGNTNAQITADLVAMLSLLEQANVRMIEPGWILSPRSANYIMSLQATTGLFVYRDEMKAGTLWGYPYKKTASIPTNLGGGANQSELYLTDYADAIIGDVPGIEIEVSREAAYVDSTGTMQAAFSQDVTVIRAIERHDFVMRHDQSVAVLTQVAY